MARELCAIIEAHRLWQWAFKGYLLELADNVGTAHGIVDPQRKTFPREVVDDRQRADRAAILDAIVHEVDRPTFIGPAHRLRKAAAHIVDLPLAPRPYLQLQRAIDSAKSCLADKSLRTAAPSTGRGPP